MSRFINGGARFLSEKMNARSVAEFFELKRKHRFDDFYIGRRCSRII
jgi:hypothetical protein